jgi:hypothetical protein
MPSKEELKGTSAEVLVAEPLGDNPKASGEVLSFHHTVQGLPPGQWKVECECFGMTGFHDVVASICEWHFGTDHPILGSGGLKVYNVVPAVKSDGRFQDGVCTVWVENTWGGNLDVKISILAAAP